MERWMAAGRGGTPGAGEGTMDQETMGRDTRFPEWLSSRIDDMGMSPAQLSRAVGVHAATVSRWLSGERSPANGAIDELAVALRVANSEVYAALGRIAPDSGGLSPLEVDLLYEVRGMPVSLQGVVLDVARRLRRHWEEQAQ